MSVVHGGYTHADGPNGSYKDPLCPNCKEEDLEKLRARVATLEEALRTLGREVLILLDPAGCDTAEAAIAYTKHVTDLACAALGTPEEPR